jgi:hypothetical protein
MSEEVPLEEVKFGLMGENLFTGLVHIKDGNLLETITSSSQQTYSKFVGKYKLPYCGKVYNLVMYFGTDNKQWKTTCSVSSANFTSFNYKCISLIQILIQAEIKGQEFEFIYTATSTDNPRRISCDDPSRCGNPGKFLVLVKLVTKQNK